MTDEDKHKLLRFPTQRPNERVILLLRRHWTVLAVDISQMVFMLIVPPIVFSVILIMTDYSLVPGTVQFVALVLGMSLYYLFTFLGYFQNFVDYHLDIWVVTDQRILSMEQSGLFRRTTSELSILRVQDVTSTIKGKVETFLDYGDVFIQTAGQQERFIFEQVPHPAEVAKVVLQVHDREEKIQEMQRVKQEEEYRHSMDDKDLRNVYKKQRKNTTQSE